MWYEPMTARKIALWAIPVSAILPLLGAVVTLLDKIRYNHQDDIATLPLAFLFWWAIFYSALLLIAMSVFAMTRLFAPPRDNGG